MTYSRRQLYAFGETLGDSVTRKIAGHIVYGGGGGNPLSAATDLVGDVVGGAADAVGDVASGATDVVGDVIQGGANAVGDVVEGTGDVLGDIVQGAGDVVEGGVDAISDLGSSIDDTVNDVIPGGWTTVLSVAAGMYGIPIEFITAAGATKGSGVLEGKPFDLEGAVRGGAGAYGAGSLGAYGAEQMGTEAALESGADTGAVSSPVQTPTAPSGPTPPPLTETATSAVTPTQAAGLETLPTQAPPAAPQGLETLSQSAPSAGTPFETGPGLDEVVARNGANYNPYTDPQSAMNTAGTGIDSVTPQTTPPTMMESIGNSISETAAGAKDTLANLVGAGDVPAGEAWSQLAADTGLSDMTPMGVAKGVAYTGLGLTALQALSAKNAGDKDAGKITNDQYLKTQAEIDKAIASAKEAVSMNPYEKDRAGAGLGRSLYQNNRPIKQAGIKTLAVGGSIDQYETPDTMMAGGITNSFHFAHGGMANEPRFLSGGGDGMSDSIKATIGGHTEARLADGEFVVPADVVSHIGNGSSKAGAKQLYDMMDRIRKARTGNPKQGKQINPHKFLPK